MSKKTAYLLGILLTIILGTILYYYLCCNCKNDVKSNTKVTEEVVATPEVKSATTTKFSVIDPDSNLAFNANEHFNFKASNFNILKPISSGLEGEIVRLSNYFKDNPNKIIDITGYYTSNEENTTAYPNLGLARANAVKNYFVSKGMSSKAMNTFGELNDNLVPDADTIFYGPLNYKISALKEGDTSNEDALKALRDDIKANPIILYFDTAATSLKLTPEQRVKVANLSRYVDKAENAKIKVIGHTDNTGNRASNIKLGQGRADFVKSYLVNNAIPESKIQSTSKGPDQPIDSNNTEQGRANNRRVEITIN
ncbi:OmpA family protein [Lacinutrix salivirga]